MSSTCRQKQQQINEPKRGRINATNIASVNFLSHGKQTSRKLNQKKRVGSQCSCRARRKRWRKKIGKRNGSTSASVRTSVNGHDVLQLVLGNKRSHAQKCRAGCAIRANMLQANKRRGRELCLHKVNALRGGGEREAEKERSDRRK